MVSSIDAMVAMLTQVNDLWPIGTLVCCFCTLQPFLHSTLMCLAFGMFYLVGADVGLSRTVMSTIYIFLMLLGDDPGLSSRLGFCSCVTGLTGTIAVLGIVCGF